MKIHNNNNSSSTTTFLCLALASLASIGHAAITTSGLVENFDAAIGANTTSLWENQVDSRNWIPSDAGTIDLGAVTSSLTTITQAYSLDGSRGFQGSSGNTFSSLVGNSNSFEMWFRPTADGLAAGGVLFETGGATGLHFLLRPDGNLSARAMGGYIEYEFSLANLGYDPTSDFTQVVFTADSANTGDGNGAKLYVNGVLVGENTAATWNGTGNPDGLGGLSGNQQLGGDSNRPFPDNSDKFIGDIAIFRIYDDILTATEVSNNFNAIAIPEPSTALLGGLGMLALLRRRRN